MERVDVVDVSVCLTTQVQLVSVIFRVQRV